MRDRVKVRKVGGSLIITLTKSVAEEMDVSEGDSLMMETLNNQRIMLIKEADDMPATQTVELELEVLERRKAAIEAETALAIHEYSNSMPTVHPYIGDETIMESTMRQWRWEIAKLDTSIAKKRLQLFEIGGRVK